ncbi:MAG: [Fe-Fe] hydrogenase large subunit C-terminal domain-containing protein [Syntrophorhabdaceae bacterium]|nr:[Fe-Fe] hydrogenase large subunit C-terminal domain-containing protein [Syntrophorhabdaceae bacterium]
MHEIAKPQIVFTLTARCRDCYRCLRACPVKAIRMQNGQAYVDEQRCIACGTCIRECPQQAKTFRNDIDVARRLIDEGHFVAASIAPSFAAVFNKWQYSRLPSALRALGIRYVGQTSHGAYQISLQSRRIAEENPARPHIATACPALINYIEKYQPQLVDYLMPLLSPMAAHARLLKEKLGKETKVIFIGPCVAKKSELNRPEVAGVVDCVLTFKELNAWLLQKGIDLSMCEESNFDEKPVHEAQLYPLPGGLIKTAGLSDDGLNLKLLRVDSIQGVRELLNGIEENSEHAIIEPLFCSQGCINGPGIDPGKNLFDRRRDIIEYNTETQAISVTPEAADAELFKATFSKADSGSSPDSVTEEQIQKILAQTGKQDPEQQLNCGACGYDSCREKAIAVALGMAEPEMCIPYMRRLAERRTDQIFSTTPNGVLMLDDELNILGMNPAFKKFFSCSDVILGRHISYLMDPAPFEKLISGVTETLDITVLHRPYNLLCRELFYMLKEERQIVGIFINITSQQEHEKKLKEIRSQTVEQANELLEHQIKMAQNIAQFLGESTARGEELVRKLMSLSEGDENNPR